MAKFLRVLTIHTGHPLLIATSGGRPSVLPYAGQLYAQIGLWLARTIFKVRKEAKIRKRYNQVPHSTQDTTWESNKNTINITNNSQEVSPFRAGDHKAAMNRRKSMRNTRRKNTNDPQKKYRLGTVCKNILLEGLNRFHGANLTLNSDVDQDT